jgi:hypothetical protein
MSNRLKAVSLLLIIFCSFGLWCQIRQVSGTTLYNELGKAVAYIADDDDSTIYLWSGEPVAYLSKDDVYGFNGKHLGWMKSGVIYNHDGDKVGATKGKLLTIPQISPIKAIKEIKPIKSIREIAPIKPIFSLSWSSDMTLKGFLLEGSD